MLEVIAIEDKKGEMVPACPNCGSAMEREGELWACPIAKLGSKVGKIGPGYKHQDLLTYRAHPFTLLRS